ncbi:class I SAM-dependent methyltransferase [Weissella viridescens]|uniref:Class I SAM-dependent methyltransferase n=2 Tax=Weissella viridescens TaxID=1629 RepID=A0A3P2RK54_WEIVI|nr:class I SAM-dependent methyltransferase [Weissella viridescens]
MYEAVELAIKKMQAAQTRLAEQLDLPAIEALIIVLEGLNHQNDDAFTQLNQENRKFVRQTLKESDFNALTPEQKRQVLQLVLVATMQEDQLQGNYQVTPDAIGMWVTFFVEAFLNPDQPSRVLDITAGSGNLLATVNLALQQRGDATTYYGVENDDTLITIASGVAALLGLDWQLDHQDALADTPDLTDQMDVVVADLPVGYYPQKLADGYQTEMTEGLTYVHHLLIEKVAQTLRPGGLGLLIVPAHLFESEQAPQLLKYFQSEDIYFQGFIQFSDKLFLDKKSSKALLMVQKPGADAVQAEPVMLAKAPDVGQKEENLNFVNQMQTWLSDNHLSH